MDGAENTFKVHGSDIDNFNIGTKIQLQTQRQSSSIVHPTVLVGLLRGEFLLVKCPVVRNVPFVFYDEEQIVVRAFTGTNIFTFNSTVSRTLLSPPYYMYIAYPVEIKASALRTALKVKVSINGTVEYEDLSNISQSLPIHLNNLSRTGAAIEIKSLLHLTQN